jgi:hypothetical protein
VSEQCARTRVACVEYCQCTPRGHVLKCVRQLLATVTVLAVLLGLAPAAVAKPAPLSRADEYHRLIDPLITVQDYGTRYFEDGAADASVVYPESTEPPYGYREPASAVVDLIRLGRRGLPILVDCLSDARLTKMRFDGNTITQAMDVPVGYLCLDILMSEVRGRPIWEPACDGDGLGVCINDGFYFRPDDYWECRSQQCQPRPWVIVVQQKWRSAYLAHRLRVHNPYDDFPVDEYKPLRTQKK